MKSNEIEAVRALALIQEIFNPGLPKPSLEQIVGSQNVYYPQTLQNQLSSLTRTSSLQSYANCILPPSSNDPTMDFSEQQQPHGYQHQILENMHRHRLFQQQLMQLPKQYLGNQKVNKNELQMLLAPAVYSIGQEENIQRLIRNLTFQARLFSNQQVPMNSFYQQPLQPYENIQFANHPYWQNQQSHFFSQCQHLDQSFLPLLNCNQDHLPLLTKCDKLKRKNINRPANIQYNKGHWTNQEHNDYEQFLNENNEVLNQKTKLKRTSKIFIQMSNFVKTRSPSQCRSHNQKFYPSSKYQQEIIGQKRKKINQQINLEYSRPIHSYDKDQVSYQSNPGNCIDIPQFDQCNQQASPPHKY